MTHLSPDTTHKLERIKALRNEADYLATQVLATGERGTVRALMRTMNIASATVWNRYGNGIPRRTRGGRR